MDVATIFEKLRTENIISYLAKFDPGSLAGNLYVIVPAILVLCLLIFFKFFRTIAILVGSLTLWWAIVHTFPKGDEVNVENICIFGAICFGVAVYWIYVFIIRED